VVERNDAGVRLRYRRVVRRRESSNPPHHLRPVCRIEQRSLISLLMQRNNSQGSHHRRGILPFRPRRARNNSENSGRSWLFSAV